MGKYPGRKKARAPRFPLYLPYLRVQEDAAAIALAGQRKNWIITLSLMGTGRMGGLVSFNMDPTSKLLLKSHE